LSLHFGHFRRSPSTFEQAFVDTVRRLVPSRFRITIHSPKRSGLKVTLARRSLLIGTIAAVAFGFPAPVRAVGQGRVARDPRSGLAIFGYDPVAYTIEGRPRAGNAAHELIWSDAPWRFSSEGNLVAFRRDPARFAPAYGGYDAEGILRGVPVLPDPAIFMVERDRLFMFRSVEARSIFQEKGGARVADPLWEQVAAGIDG
jgi:hypothetical protein